MFIAIGSHPAVLVSDRKKLVSPVVRKGAKLSQAGDIPVPGDFDGDDGKLEAGVFRPLDRTWYINQTTGGPLFLQFGLDTDTPVPSLYTNRRVILLISTFRYLIRPLYLNGRVK